LARTDKVVCSNFGATRHWMILHKSLTAIRLGSSGRCILITCDIRQPLWLYIVLLFCILINSRGFRIASMWSSSTEQLLIRGMHSWNFDKLNSEALVLIFYLKWQVSLFEKSIVNLLDWFYSVFDYREQGVLFKKKKNKNNGYEARRNQQHTHTHTKRNVHKRYMNKKQTRDDNNLFVSLFYGWYMAAIDPLLVIKKKRFFADYAIIERFK